MPKYSITDIDLRCTCGACPEQYDAYIGDKQVGYLRLRHGYFSVEYPDVGGTIIYTAEPLGDGFFEEHERIIYLTKAKEAIVNQLNQEV